MPTPPAFFFLRLLTSERSTPPPATTPFVGGFLDFHRHRIPPDYFTAAPATVRVLLPTCHTITVTLLPRFFCRTTTWTFLPPPTYRVTTAATYRLPYNIPPATPPAIPFRRRSLVPLTTTTTIRTTCHLPPHLPRTGRWMDRSMPPPPPHHRRLVAIFCVPPTPHTPATPYIHLPLCCRASYAERVLLYTCVRTNDGDNTGSCPVFLPRLPALP